MSAPSTSRAPSTGWREQIGTDEEARFARHVQQFAALQHRKATQFGGGRALHRKQLLGLQAQLIVPEGLPAHARHGLFAQPGSHPAWLRLSNGGTERAPDRKPDIRGFAIKVMGLSGPSALGQGQTDCQDFLLIQRPVTAFANSEQFVEITMASVKGPAAIVAALVRRHGLLGGLAKFARIVKGFTAPFSGFATERFYSALPMACGPYAMRLRLLPPEGEAAQAAAADDWAQDMVARLRHRQLRYTLQAQFFVDEAITPIEDGSVDWPEQAAPYTTVAYLVLEAASDFAALAPRIETAAFDPWKALADHRPLGELMRARREVYYASQQGRRDAPAAP